MKPTVTEAERSTLHHAARAFYKIGKYTVDIGYVDGSIVSVDPFLSGADGGGMRSELSDRAAKQLEEYFEGKRKEFDLPIALCGTPFMNAVCRELLRIPYGHTESYGEIAKKIGKPRACRAVGSACNKNPIVIIIPCHRVIGISGDLVGYAYGLSFKEQLLSLERYGI